MRTRLMWDRLPVFLAEAGNDKNAIVDLVFRMVAALEKSKSRHGKVATVRFECYAGELPQLGWTIQVGRRIQLMDENFVIRPVLGSPSLRVLAVTKHWEGFLSVDGVSADRSIAHVSPEQFVASLMAQD